MISDSRATTRHSSTSDREADLRNSKAELVYRIDDGERISFLSPEWLAFALENDAPELTPDNVLGRPIWDFLAGAETIHLYRIVFQRVLDTREEIVFPFRCDSPFLRRFMLLRLCPLREGGIELGSRLRRTESRGSVALLDSSASRSHRYLTLCSWCRRARTAEGDWVETEEAVRGMDLFGSEKLPRITHGICPSCKTLIFDFPQ